MNGEVSIWFLSVKKIARRLGDEEWWRSEGGLPYHEWREAQIRKNPKARLLHLGGRLLARRVLSQRTRVPASSLDLTVDQHGKPRLAGGEVEFSISHSGDMVAVALSVLPIGIDIERTDRRVDWRTISKHYFSSEEAEWLAARPAVGPRRFTALWTLKESYIKALGDISSLDAMTFLPMGTAAFKGLHQGKPASHCRFIRPNPRYLVAVSLLGKPFVPLSIRWVIA